MQYPPLKFSFNWNNKLDCNVYTTLRLSNDTKYIVGSTHGVYLKGHHHHDAIIVDKKKIRLKDVNEFIAGLDTGYTAKDCRKMIRTMYTKIKDIETRQFDFILLQKIKSTDA